jgi:flagellar biosynthetic protein FliR
VVAGQLPSMPKAAVALFVLVVGEVVVGLFIGTVTRLFLAALTIAGSIIAYVSALANALTNDPSAAQQSSIAGTFLTLVGLVVIFTLDLHHVMLAAVIDSYQIFVPGQPIPIGDFSQVITRLVTQVFLLAFQISAPFVAAGLIFYLGMGLLARLMPQIQIFFIAMPIQITMGLVILSITLPIAISWFITWFREGLSPFLLGG